MPYFTFTITSKSFKVKIIIKRSIIEFNYMIIGLNYIFNQNFN